MKLDEIKDILELMREHDLEEVELEQEGVRIRLKKAGLVQMVAAPHAAAPAVGTAGGASDAGALGGPVGPGGTGDAPVEATDLAVVMSPIVGTFYRSTEPGAAALVEIGDTVKKGQVLCIIEAMKLMNEIDSEYDGQVVNVYVENGQPVQYGERLFAIRPA